MDLVLRVKIGNMPECTDHQVEMMIHAIGADNKSPRAYNGRQIYHAYRNYYDAGGNEVQEWEDLVQKRYATKNTFFHVSPDGLTLLELLTGRSTIYDNYKNYADCRTVVLTQFLGADVYCGYGCWYPTSAATVAKALHIPVSLVRETCRKLVEEGYLVKGHEGGMDEDGIVHCYHGYYITEKARELDKWKVLYDQEMAYLNKTLNSKEVSQ
jgi:hypothetical protein